MGLYPGASVAVSFAITVAEYENDSYAAWTSFFKKHEACRGMLGYVYQPLDRRILDLFFTQKESRESGVGTMMLQALLKHAQKIGKDVTMETHHAENLSLYYKAGFVLMSEITHPDHDIHQYNLMHKCSREENLNE